MSEINADTGVSQQSLPKVEQVLRLENNRNSVLPPNKNLQVTYVVPIRGEVSTGNFFLQLKDFSRQRGISPDMYEIIYALNNKPNDVRTQNQFYQENQIILNVAQYIQGVRDSIPEGLEEWQVQIIKSAKRRKLQIQIHDVPEYLLSDSDVESNIERSRVSGENLAVQRFYALQRDGGLVMMDADTRIGWDTTTRIKEQLIDQATVGMLKIPYDQIPGEGGANIFKTTTEDRFFHTIGSLMSSVRGWQAAGWYAIKANSLGIHDASHGSPIIRDGLRPAQGETRLASGLRLYTQDRARSKEVGGQFGEIRFQDLDRTRSSPYPQEHPALSILLDLYEDHQGNRALQAKTIEILRQYFPNETWVSDIETKITNGESIRYDQSLWLIKKQFKLAPRRYAETVYQIFQTLSGNSVGNFDAYVRAQLNKERFRHNHTISTVRKLLERSYSTPQESVLTLKDLAGDKETLGANFLKNNPWVIDALQQARERFHSVDEAFASLQQEFPEFLLTFEDTTYTYPNAIILGVTRFLDEVRLNPSNFPDIAPFIGS